MSKTFLIKAILVAHLLGTSNAQELRVHEKYGVDLEFPDGWQLIGEEAYDFVMQDQLYMDRNSVYWINLQRFLHLSQIEKNNWHEGLPYSHPFDQAEQVEKLEEKDWPINKPDIQRPLLQEHKDGIAIYEIGAPNFAAYVIFIARGDSYVRLSIGTSLPDLDLKTSEMEDILRSIRILVDPPRFKEDSFTSAERAYLSEKDNAKAILLYKLVSSEHPKYEKAQEMISRLEAGNRE